MEKIHTLIIGGTKGLGKLLAKLLNEKGHTLSILARSKPEASEDYIKDALYVTADLLNESAFLPALGEVIKSNGKLHNLVFLQRFKGEGDRWQGDFEVSLSATHKIIEYLKDHFVVNKNHYGSIVIVSSVAGQLANNSQPICYSLSKAGLNNMVRFYSYELGSSGIRVNGVSPITFVKEESKKHYYEDSPALNALYKKIIPLGRMCTAEDVANVILFLCSSQSAFISGQNIDVDGGLSVISHESLARALTGI